MPKLPVTSGQNILNAFIKGGFLVVDQHGSHVKLKKQMSNATLIVIVPMHKEIAQGGTLIFTMGKSPKKNKNYMALSSEMFN